MPSAPLAPSPRRAASKRPRQSWRSRSVRGTGRSSPSTVAARRSEPATASIASTRCCSTTAGSLPTPASALPRRACARASSAPSFASPSTPSAASSTGAARGRSASSDLRVGDFVVHEDPGVARFAGFETREVGGITRDYLYLEYKGEDRVYVPTDQLAKLSRYVGAGGSPALSALGGKRWQNMKAPARRAARGLAGELINLYAERRARKGHAIAPDGEWQLALESAFPYRETPDQIEAIESVKGDMES